MTANHPVTTVVAPAHKNGLIVALEAIHGNVELAKEYISDSDDRAALDAIGVTAKAKAKEITDLLDVVQRLTEESFKRHQASIEALNQTLMPFLAFACEEQLGEMIAYANKEGVVWDTDKLANKTNAATSAAELGRILRACRPGKPSENVEDGYYWGLLRMRVTEKQAETARLSAAVAARSSLRERNARKLQTAGAHARELQEEVLVTTRRQNGNGRNRR